MTIFIGADHRGFEFKNKIVEYLQDKNIRVEDMGPLEYDANDDYPDFAQKVAQAVLQNPENYLGVVLCGSGVGVAVAANRYRGIVAGVGFNEDQVRHIRANDHANVLSIPSDHVDFETATRFIDIFISTQKKTDEKYIRRLRKLDEFEEKPPAPSFPQEVENASE